MSVAPFHVSDIFDDVDDMAWFTSAIISDLIESHAPMRSKIIKHQSVPYMNGTLRKAIYTRNMARNDFKKYGGKYFWEQNRKHRNNVVAIRKKSISNYFSTNCANHDKKFWSTISLFISDKNSRTGGNIFLQDGDKIVANSHCVSEIFNNYFSEVASEIGINESFTGANDAIRVYSNHPSIVKIEKNLPVRKDFDFARVNEEAVMKCLKNINPRKSTGYDNIPGKLVRVAHKELAAPIAKIINVSMTNNVFPDTLKCAEVSPVYKKNDVLNRENYRPVSVLTCISKVFENVLNDQLYDHIECMFDKLLSAFRKGYSCHSLLIKLVDDWKVALDQRKTIGAIFMDLSKAFDCLSHGLLVAKLHAYGLSISSCELMASYLQNRKQRVKIKHFRSSWVTLKKGVPQGSILGPLLFNVFINDMFYFIERSTLYNYADDNSLSVWKDTLEAVITDLTLDSKIAIQWCNDNGMEANPKKFQFMVLSPGQTKEVTINLGNNICLNSVPNVKVLGVLIDDRLQFNEQIRSSCNKAARQLNALARISKHLDFKSRKLIYHSFIESNFTYCPIVWHFCGRENNNKLEKLQERSLRILFDDKCSSYEELLKRAGTTTILVSRLKNMAVEVFKCVTESNTPCLNSLFEVKGPSYSFRDNSKLVQPKRNNVTHGLRSFSYLGSKLWNDLPNHIKNTSTDDLNSFKSVLRRWNGPADMGMFYHYV